MEGVHGPIPQDEYDRWWTVAQTVRAFEDRKVPIGTFGPRLLKRLSDDDMTAAVETITLRTEVTQPATLRHQCIEASLWGLGASVDTAFWTLGEADIKQFRVPSRRSRYYTLRGIRFRPEDIQRMLGPPPELTELEAARRLLDPRTTRPDATTVDKLSAYMIVATADAEAEASHPAPITDHLGTNAAAMLTPSASPAYNPRPVGTLEEIAPELNAYSRQASGGVPRDLDAPQPRRQRANPMTDREIKAWYRGLSKAQKTLGVLALWALAKDAFPGRHLPRKMVDQFGKDRGNGHRAKG